MGHHHHRPRRGREITLLRELAFPHSLGLLYSAFTYYCGFKVNSGEYKLMGLAPYGHQGSERVARYMELIREELVDIREDGSLLLNMDYFDFRHRPDGCATTPHGKGCSASRGARPKATSASLTWTWRLAIQAVTEEIVLQLAGTAVALTGCRNLVMAGGVALNCVANGKLLRERPDRPASGFSRRPATPAAPWAPPTPPGTSGWGRTGAAPATGGDAMQGGYLGPAFGSHEVGPARPEIPGAASGVLRFPALCRRGQPRCWPTGRLSAGFRGGWSSAPGLWATAAFSATRVLPRCRSASISRSSTGRASGPLHHRSWPRTAPSISPWRRASPYMLLVADVREGRCRPLPQGYAGMELYQRLYHLRSDIPAVTHIDYSARIQTVHQETNPRYWQLIQAFKELTGYGLLVNTSFNVRGEPIVCTPEDAYRCFMRTEMDYLVIGDALFAKADQPRVERRRRLAGRVRTGLKSPPAPLL